MDIVYDKTALLEYMDDIEGVGDSVRRKGDESFARYNSCKQQYSRLHTEIEQAIRRAYNRVEAAESMVRAAQAEYDYALDMLNSADEDSDTSADEARLARAEAELIAAENELSEANAEYDAAVANMQSLTELWERFEPSMEAAANKAEDGISAFTTFKGNADRDLGEYMSTMDKAQSALYEGTSSAPSANTGSVGATAAPITPSGVSSSAFKTSAGNFFERVTSQGIESFVMNIGGQTHSFPNTKSGAAKAYRTAVKSNDPQMISYTNKLFSDFGSVK